MSQTEAPILREMRLKKEAFEKASGVLKKVLGRDCPSIDQDNWRFTKRDNQEAPHSWFMMEKDPYRDVSNILFDDFIPSINTQIGFHFCPLPALKSMCQSGQIWLTQLSKRVNECEIKAFAQAHDMLGLRDAIDFKDVARDLFYASFTTEDNQDKKMWSHFGPARLKLEITPLQPNQLRPIAYLEDNTETRLAKVIREMRDANVFFTPQPISQLCAFGLPKKHFHHEKETRLLVKRHRCWNNEICSPQHFVEAVNQGFDVCPIHFLGPDDGEASKLCNIRLLGIDVQNAETKREVCDILKDSKYKAIEVQII